MANNNNLNRNVPLESNEINDYRNQNIDNDENEAQVNAYPIREFASLNMYDFIPDIIYPAFANTRFEMKHVMLQMIQTAGNLVVIQAKICMLIPRTFIQHVHPSIY